LPKFDKTTISRIKQSPPHLQHGGREYQKTNAVAWFEAGGCNAVRVSILIVDAT
jgi:hypothetical protein